MKETISVVIPACNEEKYLPALLHSLTTQSFPPHEIIVVDNGSSDRTAEVAQDLGAIVICELQRGAGQARNAGAAAASGSLISFLDADCTVQQTYFELVAHELLRKKKNVAVTGPVVFGEGLSRGSTVMVQAGQRVVLRTLHEVLQGLGAGAIGSGANFTARREIFLTAGGFRTMAHCYLEDVELAMRIVKKKLGRVVYAPHCSVTSSARRFTESHESPLAHAFMLTLGALLLACNRKPCWKYNH